MVMFNDEERVRFYRDEEDPLGPAKGVIYGTILGGLMLVGLAVIGHLIYSALVL